MEQGDHLGNIFSDEEEDNSFDAPVAGSVNVENEDKNQESCEDECEDEEEKVADTPQELDLQEEDFNLLTIEKVSMEVLTTRILRIISEMIYRGEPAAIALFDVANKIVFQSTMIDTKQNTVIERICRGLSLVITDVRERDQSAEQFEQTLMQFVAKLCIKNKSMKCCDLLYQIINLIDRMYMHTDSIVRARVYRLIAFLVEESNRYADLMREQGDSVFLLTGEDLPEEDEVIPSAVKSRWLTKLAKSLLDKSPQVRSRAVVAISLWDHDAVCKTINSDELTVNELLWKSVHDVDENVRITAARRVHIIDEMNIDKCINFIEASKDNKVRHAIIVRLASDVHLFSFSEKQRFRLVNLLNDSDSARVQDVIHQRLVESWVTVAGEETVFTTIFPTPGLEHEIPEQFPTVIIEYLDPLVDPTAVYVFMKFATLRFIRQLAGDLDVEQFIKVLHGMANSDSESVGLMRRTTFRLVAKDTDPEEELKKIFSRILITRSFVDVVFDVSKNRVDGNHLRNRALMFFLPDVTTFVEHLKQFCSVYFRTNSEVDCRELLLYNIFHLINRAVRYGDYLDDKVTYKKTLMQLLEDPNLHFSTDSVMTMITTCLDLCVSEEEREECCDWICEISNQLMIHQSVQEFEDIPNLRLAIESRSVLDRMYSRSATMLLSTCQHEDIQKPTASMTTLFKTIIPALLGSDEKLLQKIGLELIGYATTIDFVNCEPYLKLTRFLIQRDDEVLKSTGIHTLVRVIKSHGFPSTAAAIFGNESDVSLDCHDSLAKLFEKSIINLKGNGLVQSVQDCLSMLSYGKYAWPKLFCTILLVAFQKCNGEFPLVKILRSYCKTIRSDFNKLNILLGFVKAIDVVSKSNEHDASWNILEMTELVCETVSSVTTIEEDGDVIKNTDKKKELFLEIELSNRMIKRAVSRPSSWFIRHVFTAMATSLRLECVPMERLDELHEYMVDSNTIVRFNSEKTTQIAFKRFLTHCEKIITLHERVKDLKIKVDLKKVKSEEVDPDVVTSSSSLSVRRKRKLRKHNWDDDELEEKYNPDDSFEYCPKSTRSRKRKNSSTEQNITKMPKAEVEVDEIAVEELNIEDSFEL